MSPELPLFIKLAAAIAWTNGTNDKVVLTYLRLCPLMAFTFLGLKTMKVYLASLL